MTRSTIKRLEAFEMLLVKNARKEKLSEDKCGNAGENEQVVHYDSFLRGVIEGKVEGNRSKRLRCR